MKFLRPCALIPAILIAWTIPPAAAGEIVTESNRLTPGSLSTAWTGLLADLVQSGSLTARFTENRHLPFKKIPVVFTGEMRLSPERGLSLHYLTPQERILVLDQQGLLLRDENGRTRDLASEPRAQATIAALMHVLRFDLGELAKQFDLYGRQADDRWVIALEPKTSELASTIGRLVVSGTRAQVEKIEMRKSAVLSIEILISDVRKDAVFKTEDLARFYR
jgi:hypothetical protein